MLEIGSGLFKGSDVAGLVSKIVLLGGTRDANADVWCRNYLTKPHDLDGAWASRWNREVNSGNWVAGTARIQVIGKFFYALTHDSHGDCLIGAQFLDADRLAGRYLNLAIPTELLAWVGRIIGQDRIDGFWLHGRWDLRRDSK